MRESEVRTAEQKAAARGAKFLDKKKPGWHRKVKITKLDMYVGEIGPLIGECGCVLAQLDAADRGGKEGEYYRLVDQFEINPDEGEFYGFCLPHQDVEPSRAIWEEWGRLIDQRTRRWAELTEAWRDEIRARRKVKP